MGLASIRSCPYSVEIMHVYISLPESWLVKGKISPCQQLIDRTNNILHEVFLDTHQWMQHLIFHIFRKMINYSKSLFKWHTSKVTDVSLRLIYRNIFVKHQPTTLWNSLGLWMPNRFNAKVASLELARNDVQFVLVFIWFNWNISFE